MSTKNDYSGIKVNHLTLLQYSRPGGQGRGAYWKVRCDCGVVKEVIAKSVIRGRIKTCGKCQYYKELMTKSQSVARHNAILYRQSPSGMIVAQRHLYHRYMQSAIRRKHSWELDLPRFKQLTEANCSYCGTPPSQIFNTNRKKFNLKYNGIDRVDNTKGYTLDNTVPCCGFCNRLKGPYNAVEFLEKVRAIAKHTASLVITT